MLHVYLHKVNYLAHAFLSGDNDLVLIGNMMGDAVKGGSYADRYPQDISKGISLHRFIDSFADDHDLPKQGKKRLWDKYRHYSAVIIDMYYDHLLAKNWQTYSDQPLSAFVEKVYGVLESNWDQLPQKTQYMCTYMIRYDWLSSYAHRDGLERALSGLSRRTPFKSDMEHAVEDLYSQLDAFELEFLNFFPDIQQACANKLTLL